MQNNLSLLIIAKNEELTIKRCIDSAIDVVDECIVSVDYKTTDNTLKIVSDIAEKNKKITVTRHEWRDDFSAARNELIEKSKSDYYLFLDGHEYLPEKWFDIIDSEMVSPTAALKNIAEKLKAQKERQIKQIYIQLYVQPFNGLIPASFFTYPRIAHRSQKFVNATHNALPLVAWNDRVCFYDCIIIHDAPVKNRLERDIQRPQMDIKNLRRDIAKTFFANMFGVQPRAWFYLGNTYLGISEHAKAYACYAQYMKICKKNIDWVYTDEYYTCAYNAAGCLARQRDYKKAHEILVDTALTQPHRRECFIMLGDIETAKGNALVEQKQVDNSQEFYRNAKYYYNIAAITKIKPVGVSQDAESATYLPWTKLAETSLKLNELDNAIYYFERAQKYLPEDKTLAEKIKKCQEYKKNSKLKVVKGWKK